MSAVIGISDGLTIEIAGIDTIENAVVVHQRLRDDATWRERLAAYNADHERWANGFSCGEPPSGPPPDQPAGVATDLHMTLSDDVGTRYRWVSAQAGGTGTDGEASKTYEPAAPPEASRLTVSGPEYTVSFARTGSGTWEPSG